MFYKFRSHRGNERGGECVVEADNEPEARALAMEKFWGPPGSAEYPYYQGVGLILLETSNQPILIEVPAKRIPEGSRRPKESRLGHWLG